MVACQCPPQVLTANFSGDKTWNSDRVGLECVQPLFRQDTIFILLCEHG